MKRTIIDPLARSGAGHFDPQAFIKQYEEAYVREGNRNGFKTKKSFSPSTLGYSHGTCPRYWYIAFTGAEFVEDIDSRALSNMDNGSYAHDRIQNNIEKMGILRERELEVTYQEPPIRGFVDIVIEWDGKLVPGEIKTANDGSFIFRTTTGKPSGSHYVQFLIYLKILKADEGFLMYENKDTQEICIIPVTANPKTRKDVDYLFAWMNDTYNAFKEEQLPKRPWTRKNAKVCKTCPVRDECFNKYDEGVIDLPVLEVPTP